MMTRTWLVIFLLANNLFAQESGLRLSRYFSANQYGAHNQNWAVAQDSSGVMYFGNTSGILRYDGSLWQMLPTPKGGIVRSLATGFNHKLYAGAYGEFGYLVADESGKPRWISLSDSLPKTRREFSDVWRIHVTSRGVFFTSPQSIFLFDHADRFIASWQPVRRFRFSYFVRDRFIVQDEQNGLSEIRGDSLIRVVQSSPLAASRIYAMLPYGDDQSILIQTRSDGTWIWEKDQFKKISWAAGSYLEEHQVYNGMLTSWGQYLFATLRNGLVLTTQDGQIAQIYNKQSGFPDNTVYDLFTDRSEGIWLAMNRGILRADLFAPFTYWNESMGLDGAVFTVTRHDSKLYVGTSSGVFSLEKNDLIRPWILKKLKEPQAQCWALLSQDGRLLCATTSGIYEINGGKSRLITDAYTFTLSPSKKDPSVIYAGLNNGLGLLRRTPNGYTFERFEQIIHEEIRYIVEDSSGSVWLAGGFDGFQKMLPDRTVREYHPNIQERSRRNRIFEAGRDLTFITDRGLLRFNAEKEIFESDTSIARLLPDNGKFVLRMRQDSAGHLWVVLSDEKTYGQVGKIHFKKNVGYTKFLPLRRISQFGEVSTIWTEGKNIWFGGYDGLLQYQSSMVASLTDTRHIESYPDVILTVHLKNDSLVYIGQGEYGSQYEINYDMNQINFLFADPGNMSLFSQEFQYKLHGFDADWIRSNEFKKTYTFLPEGAYRFEVKSTEPHNQMRSTTFDFVIKPPFYRTWWAYLSYLMGILALIFLYVQFRSANLENERERLNKLIEQKTTELRIANNELQNSQVRLERTIDIVQAINSELDLDNLLNAIFKMVQPLLYMQSGSVLLRDNATGLFKFHAAFGIDLADLRGIELNEEEALRRYFEGGEPVAEDMYFIRGLVQRPGTDKFGKLPLIDSLFVIRLIEHKGLAGFLFFDDVREVTAKNLLLLTGLKEHIRAALTKARLLSELKLLNEKKNEYLGIVAHDLRNPLSTIVGYTDLLIEDFRKGKIKPKEAVEDLSKIAGVSRHMNRFITELLDISSIESGKVRMEFRSVDLKMIVSECESLHRRAAQNKNIELFIDYDTLLPAVKVDTSKISSVIDNLLSNAIKYSYPGGKVKVTFEREKNEIITHVHDSGQGLSDDDLKKVFTSFKRLSSKPTGGEPSTGLGLAIVKKIIELHQGRVWVRSELGKGATFSFSLPIN